MELGVTNLEIVGSLLFFDYFSGRNSLSPTRRSLNTFLITALAILFPTLLHHLRSLLHLKLIDNSFSLGKMREDCAGLYVGGWLHNEGNDLVMKSLIEVFFLISMVLMTVI